MQPNTSGSSSGAGPSAGIEGGSVPESRGQRDVRRQALSEERLSAFIEPYLRTDALQAMLADPGGRTHHELMWASGYFD